MSRLGLAITVVLTSLLAPSLTEAQTPAGVSKTARVLFKVIGGDPDRPVVSPRDAFEEFSVGITALNRNYQSLCSHKAMTIELDAASARAMLKTAKKGDRIGSLQVSAGLVGKGETFPATGLVGTGETFPFAHIQYVLGDVSLSNVLERNNGTARVTFDYGTCNQVRR